MASPTPNNNNTSTCVLSKFNLSLRHSHSQMVVFQLRDFIILFLCKPVPACSILCTICFQHYLQKRARGRKKQVNINIIIVKRKSSSRFGHGDVSISYNKTREQSYQPEKSTPRNGRAASTKHPFHFGSSIPPIHVHSLMLASWAAAQQNKAQKT